VVAVDLNADIPYYVPEESLVDTTQNHQDYRHMLLMIGRTILQYVPDGWFASKKSDNEELYSNAFEIMQDRITNFILDKFQPEIHVPVSRYACELFEFQKAEEMIRVGERAAHEALDAYERKSTETESRWDRFTNYFFKNRSDVA
jgi:NTE family protein